jgi:hypothetical protein
VPELGKETRPRSGAKTGEHEHHVQNVSSIRHPHVANMPSFKANDGINLHYSVYGSSSSPPLILVSVCVLSRIAH